MDNFHQHMRDILDAARKTDAAKEEFLKMRQQKAGQAQASSPSAPEGLIHCPPGFVGQLAQYVFSHAQRPVAEVAIVSALGIMAGLAGRDWQTFTRSGLNLYIVLVARSAIGKDAINTSTASVKRALIDSVSSLSLEPRISGQPSAGERKITMFDFTDYVSGPALMKAVAGSTCFLNIHSEIGDRFLAMSKGKDSALNSLRRVLKDLFNKSGANGVVGGLGYSDIETNTQAKDRVAYSLLGEATPKNFYESITESMMGDGFMSRFLVVEYEGDRPDENPNPLYSPTPDLVERLLAIFQQAEILCRQNRAHPVPADDHARALFDQFNRECDARIRAAGPDEGIRQLWSRAHLKVLRVATLLAVGDNPMFPVVNAEQVEWSILLIRHGNAVFEKRIRTGEVGEGTDGGREQKILDLCAEFITLPPDRIPKWLKKGEEMCQNLIIPRKYLQHRTKSLSAFDKHHLGHAKVLDLTIKIAIANGSLMEVKKDKLVEDYSFHGQAYRAISLA